MCHAVGIYLPGDLQGAKLLNKFYKIIQFNKIMISLSLFTGNKKELDITSNSFSELNIITH